MAGVRSLNSTITATPTDQTIYQLSRRSTAHEASRLHLPLPAVCITTPRIRRKPSVASENAFTPSAGTRSNPFKIHHVTPATCAGDRFIPNRRELNLDSAHYHVTSGKQSLRRRSGQTGNCGSSPALRSTSNAASNQSSAGGNGSTAGGSPTTALFSPTEAFDSAVSSSYRCQLLASFLEDDEDQDVDSAHRADAGSNGKNRILKFCGSKSKKQSHAALFSISTVLDWNGKGELVAALGKNVVCWNPTTNSVAETPLYHATEERDIATAVAWDPTSRYLAVGLVSGRLKIWDNITNKTINPKTSSKSLCGHEKDCGINSLVWNGPLSLYGLHQMNNQNCCGKVRFIRCSCTECGCIMQYDVAKTTVEKFNQTRLPAAQWTLSLSNNRRHLASCGEDGRVHVFDIGRRSCVRSIEAHRGDIKAMAWCPWESKVLATAGSDDGRICVWNNSTGNKISQVHTKSMVTYLLWAPVYRELVTSHCGTYTDIFIWKYPDLDPVGRLCRHKSRITGLVLNPNSTVLASCSNEELLIMWNCFEDHQQRSQSRDKLTGSGQLPHSSPFVTSIR